MVQVKHLIYNNKHWIKLLDSLFILPPNVSNESMKDSLSIPPPDLARKQWNKLLDSWLHRLMANSVLLSARGEVIMFLWLDFCINKNLAGSLWVNILFPVTMVGLFVYIETYSKHKYVKFLLDANHLIWYYLDICMHDVCTLHYLDDKAMIYSSM